MTAQRKPLVSVTIDFDTVRIKFGAGLHMMFYKSKLVGFQSWKHGDTGFTIEYTFTDTSKITCEYNDKGNWAAILQGLDEALY